MPGKKNFRKKFQQRKRQLREAIEGEVYGIIINACGDCRFNCLCEDGKVRMITLKGSFRKRVWCRSNDYVLVGLRSDLDRLSTMDDSKKEKGDLIWKYFPNEVEVLISNNEITYLKNGLPSSFDNPYGQSDPNLFINLDDNNEEDEEDISDEEFTDVMNNDDHQNNNFHINTDDIDDI